MGRGSPPLTRTEAVSYTHLDEDAARIGHLICHGAALDEPRNFQVFIQSHVMILQKSRPSPSLRFVHRRTSGQGSWQREALTERFYKKTAGTTAAPAAKIKLTGYPDVYKRQAVTRVARRFVSTGGRHHSSQLESS